MPTLKSLAFRPHSTLHSLLQCYARTSSVRKQHRTPLPHNNTVTVQKQMLVTQWEMTVLIFCTLIKAFVPPCFVFKIALCFKHFNNAVYAVNIIVHAEQIWSTLSEARNGWQISAERKSSLLDLQVNTHCESIRETELTFPIYYSERR